ncbi:MAG: hypothetical protein HOB54_05420 [Flavobacteriales bacterium]|nr:hypothetical protein [Flavobacteriales bacterium]
MKKFLYILILIVLFSCKKEEEVSEIPIIDFVSIFPTTAQEYTDDIIITISYTDGDGDLGENNPDIYNLFVEDNRNNIIYHFRIPELSPSGSTITIEGNFNITINGTGITDSTASQKVNYDIYIKDRAGNTSNKVTTSSITIQQ